MLETLSTIYIWLYKHLGLTFLQKFNPIDGKFWYGRVYSIGISIGGSVMFELTHALTNQQDKTKVATALLILSTLIVCSFLYTFDMFWESIYRVGRVVGLIAIMQYSKYLYYILKIKKRISYLNANPQVQPQNNIPYIHNNQSEVDALDRSEYIQLIKILDDLYETSWNYNLCASQKRIGPLLKRTDAIDLKNYIDKLIVKMNLAEISKYVYRRDLYKDWEDSKKNVNRCAYFNSTIYTIN